MSSHQSLFPFAAVGLTAFVLVTALFFFPDFAAAGENTASPPPSCSCQDSERARKPKFAVLAPDFDEGDEVAALESLQFALSEVADGSSYVWHRSHGRLSGVVHPTASFKDAEGAVCRHVVVVLSGAEKTKKTETVACRLANGVWRFDG